MATTDQVRKWYPDLVTNHHLRGRDGYQPKVDYSKAVRVPFPAAGGGVFREPVHPATEEAWTAYITAMVYHGETMPGSGGVDNPRNIAGTNWPSLHAYCVAVDLPPNSRKSAAFQSAALGIRTKSGARVFRNLALINDRMHDQIDCSPADLASGIDWSTVSGGHMADHEHKITAETPELAWGDEPWAWYQDRDFTSVPESRVREARREDLAFAFKHNYDNFIRPLEKELVSQAREIAELKTQLESLRNSGSVGSIYGRVVKLTKPD